MSKKRKDIFFNTKLIFLIAILGLINSLTRYSQPQLRKNNLENHIDSSKFIYTLNIIKHFLDISSFSTLEPAGGLKPAKKETFSNKIFADIKKDDKRRKFKAKDKNDDKDRRSSKSKNLDNTQINNSDNNIKDLLSKKNINIASKTCTDNYITSNSYNSYLYETKPENKVPIFIDNKTLEFPINIKAEVKDNIIDIENITYKIIKFNSKIIKNNKNNETSDINLFYDGVLRIIVKYIYFDRKVDNIFTAKSNMIIFYSKFSGYSDMVYDEIKKESEDNFKKVKIDLKDSIFNADYIARNKKDLREINDKVYSKFNIIGKGSLNIDILLDSYLQIYF